MKLIHLSDLHLGKRVNGFSMIEDQEYILKEILTIIGNEQPDGILIAGDVYDRSVPPEDAVSLWDSFLIRLAEMKIPVYAISGNHDSAVRFADHGALVESTGIFLAPAYDGKAKKCVLESKDKKTKVNIYMLPFVKPAIVKSLFSDEEISTYSDACKVCIDHMNVDTSEINILIAHQFVTGAERCDSEDIPVGGLDNVDVSVFDDFDYVALGHLHGRQYVGRETVRYSGTPLKYSFSEKDHVKSVTVIEIGSKEDIRCSEIGLTPMHDLREIRGSFDEVMSKSFYEGTPTDDYIHMVLTDEQDVPEAFGKLLNVYTNLMLLSYDNKRTRENRDIDVAIDVEQKTPLELLEELYELQNNQKMSDEQREFAIKYIESIWEN